MDTVVRVDCQRRINGVSGNAATNRTEEALDY
jgi:hypothetical protein